MTQHLYSLQDILAYTPGELDAYLATKDWACEELVDKRKAALLFLHADGLLTPAGVEYVTAPNFSEAIMAASQLAPRLLIPKDYRPIVCLTHAVESPDSVRKILTSGSIIPSLTLDQVAHPEWTERGQFNGVYMMPYLAGRRITYLSRSTFFTFSPSLLDRGDFHINLEDNWGHILDMTWSQPTIDGWLNLMVKFPRGYPTPEVIFHHPVRIDATDRLTGIWVLEKDGPALKTIIEQCERPDLIEYVKMYATREKINDERLKDTHAWPPIEPQNPIFCTAKLGEESRHPIHSGDRLAKMAVNCGLTPDEITTFIDTNCPDTATCSKPFYTLFEQRKLGIMTGRIPVPAPVYYPPLNKANVTGVRLPAMKYEPLIWR